MGVAEVGVVLVGEVGGVHEMAGLVQKMGALFLIGLAGSLLERFAEFFYAAGLKDVVVGGAKDVISLTGVDRGDGVESWAIGVEEMLAENLGGEMGAEEGFVILGVEVGEVAVGGIGGEGAIEVGADFFHLNQDDFVAHEGGSSGESVRVGMQSVIAAALTPTLSRREREFVAGKRMADSRIDADEAEAGWDGEIGLEVGGLAEEAKELVLFAQERGDLVHDAAGCADDLVFYLLAEGGDAHGIEGDLEMGEEVEDRGDFEGGGGGEAGAHGNGGVEGEVEAFDVGVGEVEKFLVVKDEEAAGDVGGEFTAGFGEVAAEGIDGGVGEGVEGYAEGEGEVSVKEIEREDLELAVGALLEGEGDGAIEG
jgi:hypothetical protein